MNPRKRAQRALNRLSVACLDERVALEPAARHMGGERAVQLRLKATRRATFVDDLARGVVALGGVPARSASRGARLSAALRSVRTLAIGIHQGDDYATCAAASARTAHAYAEALRLDLRSAARFGIERQYAEIDFDSMELRRLRWGASSTQVLTSPPGGPVHEFDASALASWAEDGGGVSTAG